MKPLNPSMTTAGVLRRLEREEDPIVRRNIETVLRHQEAEIAGDVDAVMATLVHDPVFHFDGILDASGNIHSSVVSGHDAVRAMYEGAVASKAALFQEFDCRTIVADRRSLAYSGWLRVPMDGAGLVKLGYDADPNKYYINEGMHWTFWNFDENGLGLGEDIGYDARSFLGILSRPIDL